MEESEDECVFNQRGSTNHKKNKRPVTELEQNHPQVIGGLNTFSSNDSDRHLKAMGKQQVFARRYSPMQNDQILYPQHFSSIQNQFEESKTNSIFKNDSIF
jgi:hypothetical protein